MASVTAFSIVLMLFFVACGGGDSGEQAGQNDDGTQSEAPDNSSRASSGNAEDLIIGRWVELPNAQLGDSGGSILEFRSDGTYIGGGRTFSRQITGGDQMSLGGMPTEFTVTQDELVLIPSISGIAQTYRRFQTLAESPSTQRRPDASPSNAEIDLDVPQFLALGGSLPSGVDVGDVDGDGNQDIVTVNRGWPASDSSEVTWLFRNSPDSLVGTSSITLLLGNGDGSFQSFRKFQTGDWPSDVSIADVNGDGIGDVVSAHRGVPAADTTGGGVLITPLKKVQGDITSGESIFIKLGNGYQQDSFGIGGGGVVAVEAFDLNGDGNVDIVALADEAQENVFIIMGNSGFEFEPPIIYSVIGGGKAIAIADLNDDTFMDVVITHSNRVSVLFGAPDGTLQPPLRIDASGSNSDDVEIGDVNRDGIKDIVTAGNFGYTVMLGGVDGNFKSFGNKFSSEDSFSDIGLRPFVLLDWNGDSRLDFVGGDDRRNEIVVLEGDGEGAFPYVEENTTRFSVGSPGEIDIGDFTSDGISDIVVTDRNGSGVVIVFGTSHSDAIAVPPAPIATRNRTSIASTSTPTPASTALVTPTPRPRPTTTPAPRTAELRHLDHS